MMIFGQMLGSCVLLLSTAASFGMLVVLVTAALSRRVFNRRPSALLISCRPDSQAASFRADRHRQSRNEPYFVP